ncbi:hypothetical protein BJ322DRAFT_1104989 [Thelephora terrestris]|uniref:Uncharacterized protein n=1 Tax=Thelephora terrestris TaxID=56493 RepID=A0A9P6HPE8_9AGAM|nr:hypothetical protein BJ322DRAFT_1104989 [Thelephora terrestris]
MFSAPNPFPSTSPVQRPVVPDARRSIWEYKLLRSLQVNRTTGLLTHFPYYRPFAALDAGVTTPPFLLGADHQFLWNSDLTESVLATVYFSVSPAFYFPSPKVHLTTNVHTHCPALIILWWDIPTELPYSIIEYLVHFEQLSGQDFEPPTTLTVAHVNERIDGRREEIEALENWKEDMQGVIHGQEDSVVRQGADIDLLKGEVTTLKDLVRALVTKTGELEDDKVRLTRRISELTGEVRDLQRRCNEPEVQVEEEEPEVPYRAGSPIIPNRAESPPARLLVRHENRLVPIDDEVIEIGSDEFYQNVGVVRRDTPRPEFVSTPWGSRRQWPALEYDPYAEFVPDSEPNSDTELPDYDDLSDVDPNEIREQNWLNEELVRSALEVVQRIRRDID